MIEPWLYELQHSWPYAVVLAFFAAYQIGRAHV